jgi:hypothetical protein
MQFSANNAANYGIGTNYERIDYCLKIKDRNNIRFFLVQAAFIKRQKKFMIDRRTRAARGSLALPHLA